MLIVYINGSDQTIDLEDSTLRIENVLQQRTDTAAFKIKSGNRPTENQDVKIYKSDLIDSIASNVVTLQGIIQLDTNAFYQGQKLKIGIGNADEEEVQVDSYDESTLQITLVAAPVGTHAQGDSIGELIFGGIVSEVEDLNVEVLANLEYEVVCVDYTKIFDKKLVSDTWEDVDSRYIINSFLNTDVNLNNEIDAMDYENTTALRAEWIESGDGNNPTQDNADYIENLASAVFDWTFAGGTATFTGSPDTSDISDLVGAASGTPTKGALMIWGETSDQASITSIKVRIGSDSSNYAEITMPDLTTATDWQYLSADFDTGVITGTPDWTAVVYAAIIITQTVTGQVKFNGLRVNAANSFTMYGVESSPEYDDMRSPAKKPSDLMQLFAKTWEYVWFIDYNRDIHFKPKEADDAPYSITTSSNNFTGLRTQVDVSQLGNRITVSGGEKHSDSTTYQIFEGNLGTREWDLLNKFADLNISIDNNSLNAAAEAGTTTINIKITGHGLVTDDFITNRSRNNVRRQITYIDNDNFTVEAVTGQTTGDTISFFSVAKVGGIDTVDPATVDYIYNSNAANVKATDSEATLEDAEFIQFNFKERVEINLIYSDSASVSAMKALGFGDGIKDLDPVVDRNIQDVATALAVAQAKVREFSNPVITGSFTTDQHGLKAGQLLYINETGRGIDDHYIIQRMSMIQRGGQFGDYFVYSVKFGTTLFGWIEFMQKLLAIKDKVALNTEAIPVKHISEQEILESSEVNQVATDGGFNSSKGVETTESSETNTAYIKVSETWQFETSVGQTLETRFDLADFG
jgi:hypothetical protein